MAARTAGLGGLIERLPDGLDTVVGERGFRLSGGEKQRVAIARAVAKRPQVLLCDEPTGALDVTTGVVVLEAIQRVNQSLGTTTAVITHNAVISQMANRVVSLFDGRVVDVRRNESIHAARDLEW